MIHGVFMFAAEAFLGASGTGLRISCVLSSVPQGATRVILAKRARYLPSIPAHVRAWVALYRKKIPSWYPGN